MASDVSPVAMRSREGLVDLRVRRLPECADQSAVAERPDGNSGDRRDESRPGPCQHERADPRDPDRDRPLRRFIQLDPPESRSSGRFLPRGIGRKNGTAFHRMLLRRERRQRQLSLSPLPAFQPGRRAMCKLGVSIGTACASVSSSRHSTPSKSGLSPAMSTGRRRSRRRAEARFPQRQYLLRPPRRRDTSWQGSSACPSSR